MTDNHLADILRGDSINPPPYLTSIRKEQLWRDAHDLMNKVSELIPTTNEDRVIFAEACIALQHYLSIHNNQSRRLEYEYNKRLYSRRGLTPTES